MKPQVISFHCVLKSKVGKIISSTFNKDVFTQPCGDCLPGLSKGLQNLKAGEKRQIFVPASEAYGFYDLDLVLEISRKQLPNGASLKVGDEVLVHARDHQLKTYRVIQANSKTLSLDGNHPLAGQDLIFDVEGVQVRNATALEIEEMRQENLTQIYH